MAKQRTTTQRKIVLEAVKKSYCHPTADDVYVEVHMENPKISRGTVYRNLNLLAENGEIQRIPVAEGADRYDCRTDRHYHFRCKECGELWDMDLPQLADLEPKIIRDMGFTVEGHRLLYYGLCDKCQRALKSS